MKTTLLLGLILISFLGSCCSGRTTNEVFIRDTTYVKVPPIIEGSGTPQIITDTLVEYVKIKGVDTVIKFSYLPAKRIVEYVVKPDTVKFAVRDTLYNTKVEERIIETPLMSKIGLILSGIAIAYGWITVYRGRQK